MESKNHILDNILKKDMSQKNNYHEFFSFLKKIKHTEYFVKTSIFDKNDYNVYKMEFQNKLDNKRFSKLEKACIGSMLGMAVGDALGAKVEFLPLDYNFKQINDMNYNLGGAFNLKPGQWTDDTSMGLCLADSLIEKKGYFDPNDIMMRFILWWYCGYNNTFRFDEERKNKHSVGLGGNISGSIEKYIREKGKNPFTKYGNKNTSGNGSIMRNAAIPICYYRNEENALNYAESQSLITHQGDEAAGCCRLLTFIIVKILKTKIEKNPDLIDEYDVSKFDNNINLDICQNNNNNLKTILNSLIEFKCDYDSVNCLAYSQTEEKNKNRNWNWKDKDFKYNEERVHKQSTYIGSYCMDCLAMALHVLYHTNNFKDAILKVVNLCGDADSVGSVVGQIAGAYYELDSIPEDWIKAINKWDHNEIALRGYILCNLNPLNDNIIFRKRENKDKNDAKCCNIF